MIAENLILKIEDLHVQFRTREGVVRAVNGVNLKIRDGETLGFVGESGCGKSVASQAILRILPPSGKIVRGKILLHRYGGNGSGSVIDLTKVKERGRTIRDVRRKDISIIFQEPMTALSPVHTIGNQIIESIRLRENIAPNKAREKAIKMLAMVGIPKPEMRIDSYTFELSGGMRQRAMIAMALSSQPKLLIADEPTTAVDVTIQAQILELLQHLQEELKMTTLIITHNLGVVAEMSHRVAVMYMGRIVEEAGTEIIFHDPKHPYTQGLINSIPKLTQMSTKRLWAIKGVVPSPYAVVPGCTFHPRCHSFISGLCDRKVPQTVEVSPGHKVSCLLYENRQETPDG